MLNLAALRFANCFYSEGGPINSIEDSSISFNGENFYVANARLNSGLSRLRTKMDLFAPVDGTGIDRSRSIARYKAISEALERWAYYEASSLGKYGFNVEPTSLGMAAYPGLFARQSRKFALREAIERWALVSWWSGLLGATECRSPVVGVDLWEIEQPMRRFKVFISRKKVCEEFSAFGVGCGTSESTGVEQTILEMERSRILLEGFFDKNPGFENGDLDTIADPNERRLIYFSQPEGLEAFEDRLSEPVVRSGTKHPRKLFDGPVKGPWSKYATVWRVVFEMPNQGYLDPDSSCFYW